MSLETALPRRGRRERLAQVSRQSTPFLLNCVCQLWMNGASPADEDEVIPFAAYPLLVHPAGSCPDASTLLSNRKSIPGFGFICEAGRGARLEKSSRVTTGGVRRGSAVAPRQVINGQQVRFPRQRSHLSHCGNSSRGEGGGAGLVTFRSAPFLSVYYCFAPSDRFLSSLFPSSLR